MTVRQHSLSQPVNHNNCGQAPAKQEHHQEKEGGCGGAKRLQCWPTIIEESDLRSKVQWREKKQNVLGEQLFLLSMLASLI